MAVKKGSAKDAPIEVTPILHESMIVLLRGTSPLICNSMSAKARQQLLLPAAKKNAAEKASSLKHDPVAEFRRSCYKSLGDDEPTRILMPSTAIKGAIRSVAVDIPGAAKAQIGRLLYVEGENVSIYGIPRLLMRVVRSADMNKTPDVRTRAVLAEWACKINVTFVTPLLKGKTVGSLIASAGIMRGIGDWRTEKGSGNYGSFAAVGLDDKEFARIVKTGGREAQDAALEEARPYDQETAELLDWFNDEIRRRGLKLS